MSQNSHPNNLLMFKAGISECFQDIAQCVSKEDYSTILTLLEGKSLAKKLHGVMQEDLEQSLGNILEKLTTDECLVEGMTKLAKLMEETEVPSDVKLWRPPGDVELHMRSLDAEKIKTEIENLEKYKENMEKENEELIKIVSEKRKSLQTINNHMKRLLEMPFKLSELENTVEMSQNCIGKLYDNNLS